MADIETTVQVTDYDLQGKPLPIDTAVHPLSGSSKEAMI
jgi:hypothetical protein